MKRYSNDDGVRNDLKYCVSVERIILEILLRSNAADSQWDNVVKFQDEFKRRETGLSHFNLVCQSWFRRLLVTYTLLSARVDKSAIQALSRMTDKSAIHFSVPVMLVFILLIDKRTLVPVPRMLTCMTRTSLALTQFEGFHF